MFAFVTNLMLHKQLVFEEGSIVLFTEPITMFPVYCMVDTLKELEKSNAENLLYRSFRELGIKWTKNLIKNYKMKTKQDVIRVGSDIIAMAGYGVVKTLAVDVNTPMVQFRLEKSSLADQYGSSDHAVDHLFRGMATGCMCAVFDNLTLEGVEVACRAKGDKECEVIVKPKNLFDSSNPLVKKQLNL